MVKMPKTASEREDRYWDKPDTCVPTKCHFACELFFHFVCLVLVHPPLDACFLFYFIYKYVYININQLVMKGNTVITVNVPSGSVCCCWHAHFTSFYFLRGI